MMIINVLNEQSENNPIVNKKIKNNKHNNGMTLINNHLTRNQIKKKMFQLIQQFINWQLYIIINY